MLPDNSPETLGIERWEAELKDPRRSLGNVVRDVPHIYLMGSGLPDHILCLVVAIPGLTHTSHVDDVALFGLQGMDTFG